MAMKKKPNRQTAMLNIIELVRDEFPFDAPETQICGDPRFFRDRQVYNTM